VANKGSILTTGQVLNLGDYLVSESGLFYATVQPDGNFCVYRGSGPDDNHGGIWCANDTSLPDGQFFANMQTDGNFCVYKGTGPADNHGGVWCSMQTDPVIDFEISNIEYDTAAATTLQSGPAELYRQTVSNNTSQAQTSSISGSASVTETSGWSDSLAVKLGVKTTIEVGIPFIADGKVELSLEVTNTYTWNGSISKTKTWGFNTPVSVPPHITIVGLVSATLSTISVPYTLRGTFIHQSGVRLQGSITGTYVGTNSHDLTVTFIQQGAVTSPKALRATST
jgi:hypothetical protein